MGDIGDKANKFLDKQPKKSTFFSNFDSSLQQTRVLSHTP